MAKRANKPVQIDLEELIDAKQAGRGYVHDGDAYRFLPDPTPIAPPIGYQKLPSMFDRVRDMVRSEQLRQAAIDNGDETFEEADDFDVGDVDDFQTPYEEMYEGLSATEIMDPERRVRALKEAQEADARAANKPGPAAAPEPPKKPPEAPKAE